MPNDTPAVSDALARVRAYHETTKHLPGRFAPAPGYMDWANQPDPFRRFFGARNIELPLVPNDDTPPYGSLFLSSSTQLRPLTADNLGLFLELSLGLTAWKEFQGTRWALRSNPSSGNLHPTEGYVVLPPTAPPSVGAGVFHYAPSEHALEQRCKLSKSAADALGAELPAGGFLVGLTSIHWREAWKYGERAYRYCQHDVGHALGSLCIAAAALNWRIALLSALSDTEVAGILGVDRATDFASVEAEHPDLIATVVTDPATEPPCGLTDEAISGLRASDWAGTANRLSPDWIDWAGISAVEKATVKSPTAELRLSKSVAKNRPASASIGDDARSAAIIRQRRSAVDMDGQTELSKDIFFRMLGRTLPDRPHLPWTAIGFSSRISLFLFVHRIDGLPPGLYVLVREAARLDALVAASSDQFAWERVGPSDLPLYALTIGDCRNTATQTSCFQEIAGDGAFSLGMVADFARTLEEDGAWAYRRLFWEAGLIGQVLYLEAEAVGVRATGIGCYFDDVMHRLLGLDLSDDTWQSLYHFTVGGGVDDGRLTTLPAYGHLPPERHSRLRHGRISD